MEQTKLIQTAFELRELSKNIDKELDFFLAPLNSAAKQGNNYFLHAGNISSKNRSELQDRGFRVESFEDSLRNEFTKISF